MFTPFVTDEHPKNKYGTKSVKIAKVPQNERLSNSCSELFRVVLVILLSHAEVLEDVGEDFVGGDLSLSGYFC